MKSILSVLFFLCMVPVVYGNSPVSGVLQNPAEEPGRKVVVFGKDYYTYEESLPRLFGEYHITPQRRSALQIDQLIYKRQEGDQETEDICEMYHENLRNAPNEMIMEGKDVCRTAKGVIRRIFLGEKHEGAMYMFISEFWVAYDQEGNYIDSKMVYSSNEGARVNFNDAKWKHTISNNVNLNDPESRAPFRDGNSIMFGLEYFNGGESWGESYVLMPNLYMIKKIK